MRNRVTGTLLAAMLVATGCATDDGAGSTPTPQAATDTAVAGTASATPATDPEPDPTVVPGSALLGPEDIPGIEVARPTDDDDEYDAYLRPPRPCAAGGESDATRLAAAHVHYRSYDPVKPTWPQRPLDLMHLVMIFEDGGAERYMQELRDELRRCPEGGGKDLSWQPVRDGVIGDSVLGQVTERWVYGGPVEQTLPFLVARTGNAVVVLADLGWETLHGEEQPLFDLIELAVERARTAR